MMLTSSIRSNQENKLLFKRRKEKKTKEKDGEKGFCVFPSKLSEKEENDLSSYLPTLPPNNRRSRNFVMLDERKRFPLCAAC